MHVKCWACQQMCIEAKVHGCTIARDAFECALADFKFACLCMLSLYLGIVGFASLWNRRVCVVVESSGLRLCGIVRFASL